MSDCYCFVYITVCQGFMEAFTDTFAVVTDPSIFHPIVLFVDQKTKIAALDEFRFLVEFVDRKRNRLLCST